MKAPTVDLAINSRTGEHNIEVVFDDTRQALEPASAAQLAADLATVLSFTIQHTTIVTSDALILDEPMTAPLVWHRPKVGTRQYVADLGEKGKALVFPEKNSKGWNIKINGRKINKDGPLSRKQQAYELVNRIVQEQPV